MKKRFFAYKFLFGAKLAQKNENKGKHDEWQNGSMEYHYSSAYATTTDYARFRFLQIYVGRGEMGKMDWEDRNMEEFFECLSGSMTWVNVIGTIYQLKSL